MAKGKKFSKVRRTEIQFKKSLFRFTLMFAVVFFAGLVTRYFMSTISLTERILKQIEVPDKYTLSLNRPEIRLRSGFLPVLGISVQRIEIQDKQCPIKKMTVQDALVTLDLIKLLNGELKPGAINVDFLEVNFPKDCPNSKTTLVKPTQKPKSELAENKKDLTGIVHVDFGEQKIKDFFANSIKQIKDNKFKRININNFKFNYLQSMNQEIRVSGALKAKFQESISAKVKLKSLFVGGRDVAFSSASLQFEVDGEEAGVRLKSTVREGTLSLVFNVLNKVSYPSSLDFNMDKLPVSSLSSLGFSKNEINYLWASCIVKSQAPWRDITKVRLEFSNCKVDGPYGEIVFNEIHSSFSKVSGFEVEANKVSMDKVLKSKRELYLSGVLANYGVLSGKLSYKDQKVNAKGFLEGSEFIFSNNNLRDIQKVKKIPFSFTRDKKNWTIRLKKIELDEGEFDGDVFIQLLADQAEARGRVSVHKLRLNPRVYKLMLDAQPTDIKVYGKFLVKNKKLERWSALLATARLQSEFYSFKNLKVRGQSSKHEVSQLRVTAGEGYIAAGAPIISWIQPTRLQKKWQEGNITFKELSTHLDVFRDRSLAWRRGYLLLNSGWQLSSEGTRSLKKEVNAWMQWDRPDGRFLKWDYKGSFFKGAWQPMTPWVKYWLNINSEFLQTNKSIDYKTTNPKTFTEKINSVGKKAIEKVREVLKKKESSKGK